MIAAAYKICFMLRVREFECRATWRIPWDFFDPVVVRLVTGTYCPDSKRPNLTICRIAVTRLIEAFYAVTVGGAAFSGYRFKWRHFPWRSFRYIRKCFHVTDIASVSLFFLGKSRSMYSSLRRWFLIHNDLIITYSPKKMSTSKVRTVGTRYILINWCKW